MSPNLLSSFCLVESFGMCLPVSMLETVCKVIPTKAASCCWVSFDKSRASLTVLIFSFYKFYKIQTLIIILLTDNTTFFIQQKKNSDLTAFDSRINAFLFNSVTNTRQTVKFKDIAKDALAGVVALRLIFTVQAVSDMMFNERVTYIFIRGTTVPYLVIVW